LSASVIICFWVFSCPGVEIVAVFVASVNAFSLPGVETPAAINCSLAFWEVGSIFCSLQYRTHSPDVAVLEGVEILLGVFLETGVAATSEILRLLELVLTTFVPPPEVALTVTVSVLPPEPRYTTLAEPPVFFAFLLAIERA